jgi:putative Mg2+ transporter-C (MgtC) family protein
MDGLSEAFGYYDAARLLLAVALGGLIGFERGWRGHAAGPHTNSLIAFGAALFVMSGQELGGDATGRIISQVATGVGFLAGGVILRDGLRVRGLNTAATAWGVGAIGCLVGVGHIWLAVVATAIVLAANVIMHLVEHHVPRFRRVSDADRQQAGEPHQGQ